MANIILRKAAEVKLSQIPLSNDTISDRIHDMSKDILAQVVADLISSPAKFSLQLEETIDVSNLSQLAVFVRYVKDDVIKEDFLLYKPLTTTTKAADVKKLVDDFFKVNNLSWDMVSAVCSDGAPSMLGRKSGFGALVKVDAQHIVVTHYILHRHTLATKTMPPKLAEVLKIVVECVNYVRNSALRHRIFKDLRKEMGSEFEVLLYHSSVRWLSRGQVMNRVFAIREELALFLQEHQHDHADCFKNSEFILMLAYMADFFAAVNHLNQQMQGGGINIIEAEENLKVFQKSYCCGYDEQKAALQDANLNGGTVSHFEPQVAILCDSGLHGQEAYHPQFMTEQGRWQTDLNSKATCLKDKMDILDYCKKMYPKRDITNIVESSHYLKIGSWCRAGSSPAAQARGKCKTARWVKPFRCLEGPFQSDALLVPENCLFDHIHNQSNCWTFGRWNATAANACQERGLQLRSFAMLLPCGISLFSGVEFVCCPKHFKDNMKPSKKPVDLAILKNDQDMLDTDDDSMDSDEDDDKDDLDDLADDTELADDPSIDEADDEDDDDYDDGDQDWDVTPSSTTSTSKPTTQSPSTTSTTMKTTSVPTPDPYFTHFDPRNEHQSYKEAQERLEETHREKVTHVMKDWSDLEERYQDMRATDPRGADAFKQRMTQRFQQTVQALEEEGDAEKHQLAAMHQQRVLAHINQRKKEAMACYTQALNDQPPNTHRVQKCLQKLLRSLHKDRAHAITHYRHLLSSSLEAAAREQPRTLERLTDIDRTVNQSMQMLKRFPELSNKIGQLMDDYIQALRSKDETPGALLAMTSDAEQSILDKYRDEVVNKQQERERQRLQEKARKEQRKKERTELREEKKRVEAVLGKKISNFDAEDMEDESLPTDDKQTTMSSTFGSTQSDIMSNTITTVEDEPVAPHREVDDAAVQQAVEDVAAVAHQQDVIRIAHAMTHDFGHGEPTYSVRREVYGRKDGRSVYFTLAFAGMALMAAVIVGIAVAKRRSARSPQSQGFIEVDQAVTPEERHVANMQINGYENPTYKYFEVKE